MDEENNSSTTADEVPKTIEDHGKLPHNPKDANQNASEGSGDMSTTNKKGEMTSNEELSTSASSDKIKEGMFGNVSNENDPSSEDIELKWDDEDMDESVLDDDVSGLINCIELSKGDEKAEFFGDGLPKPADSKDDMPMDVDIAVVFENSGDGDFSKEKLNDKDMNSSTAVEFSLAEACKADLVNVNLGSTSEDTSNITKGKKPHTIVAKQSPITSIEDSFIPVFTGEKLKEDECLMILDTKANDINFDSNKPLEENIDKKDCETSLVSADTAVVTEIHPVPDAIKAVEMAEESSNVIEVANEAAKITTADNILPSEKSDPKSEAKYEVHTASNIILSNIEDDPVTFSTEEHSILSSEPSINSQMELITISTNPSEVEPETMSEVAIKLNEEGNDGTGGTNEAIESNCSQESNTVKVVPKTVTDISEPSVASAELTEQAVENEMKTADRNAVQLILDDQKDEVAADPEIKSPVSDAAQSSDDAKVEVSKSKVLENMQPSALPKNLSEHSINETDLETLASNSAQPISVKLKPVKADSKIEAMENDPSDIIPKVIDNVEPSITLSKLDEQPIVITDTIPKDMSNSDLTLIPKETNSELKTTNNSDAEQTTPSKTVTSKIEDTVTDPSDIVPKVIDKEDPSITTPKEAIENVEPSIPSAVQPSMSTDNTTEAVKILYNSTVISNDTTDVEEKTPEVVEDSTKPLEDAEDEVPEFTDSLGLLAESSGPMDEEEDPEMEDEDDGDDDEEGDDDQDDESNHPITADQSEDSNAHTSENDAPNATDIEISEDSFAGKLGGKETDGGDAAGATEKGEGAAESMDVDDVFDKLMASSSAEKSKEVPVADKVLSEDKSEDKVMNVEEAKVAESPEDKSVEGSISEDKTTAVNQADRPKGDATPPPQSQDKAADTPSKCKKLARSTQVSMNIMSIVDLEESSSEDDVQMTAADDEAADASVTDVPSAVEDAAQQNTSVGKPAANKSVIRLNTDEITIKTATCNETPLIIPEAKMEDIAKESAKPAPKFGLEVFTLDSDEEDGDKEKKTENKAEPLSEEKDKPASPSAAPVQRCSNQHCRGAETVTAPALKYLSKRPSALCSFCESLMDTRLWGLMEGVRDLRPLLELDMDRPDADLVEISDSDSDDGIEQKPLKSQVLLGAAGAKLMEEQLADMINGVWCKYKMDGRLAMAKDEVEKQMEQLEKERVAIDSLLDDCQAATDSLRRELYAAFALPQRQLPPLEICDTLHQHYARVIDDTDEPPRRSKRPRAQSKEESQAKRPAIPLGFTGNDMMKDLTDSSNADGSKGDDDNTDIKVVALSAEAAPTGLPAHGFLNKPPLVVGQTVLAMKHAFGPWLRATVLSAPPRGNQPFSSCRVRFEETPMQRLKPKNPLAMVSARHLAYAEPADVRLTIGTRVTALYSDKRDPKKRKSFYSGVVAEMPNPVNAYRYLVFFDDGYAQYVSHSDTHVVCECSPLVWEEVHPFSREFVHQYLRSYPERPMVRLHAGQSIKTEWNGKWWVSRVLQVDASLAEVYFEADNRYEWIYRGSTRLAPLYLELQAAERHRNRPLPRSTQGKKNMPYVEYTRSDEQEAKSTQQQQAEHEAKRQRAVAKKSTTAPANQVPPPPQPISQEAVMSRVVYYTPKAAVKPHKMVPHICSSKCKRTDVLPLKELRTYNPLARPLLSGWERQLVRHRGRKEVMYRTPCGRRVRNMSELHRYLRIIHSEMSVDLFDFSPTTHCLAEFVLNRCIVTKKDLSHGKENVPVPCVNYYDSSLPEFCSYNTERTPTAGVPLNLDPDFLCGCDCEDDCQDKTKCNCWKLTLDGARTVGQDGDDVGYVYKRLLDPVPAGIYECNSRCKCKHTCLNRVAQHPLQLKLQVFKTQNRGWGIRALNDVPRGAFLCVYAGNLLTDATANLDGINEGDEYLAELDYIEVVEGMKEGYEEDIPDRDKELDSASRDSQAESESASSEDERPDKRDEDGDFQPIRPVTQQQFNKRLRRRDKKDTDKVSEEKEEKKETESEPPTGEKEKGDCITISDDEEVREPSRFMAQADMESNEQVSKYRSVRSLYGKDEACYIMDAKVQGNIGRYLNHSCTPNVFVQNVFVDTHDPRFPWVAFFALSHIRAGTELTWNYNYDVGSVPDKVLYCYCGAVNCRGRLL